MPNPAAAAAAKINLRTPNGVLSYPSLLSPRTMQGQTEPMFSMVLVFSATDLQTEEFKKLKAEAGRVARERWADKLPPTLKSPFRNNSDKDVEPFISNPKGMFLSLRSKQKPGVVDEKRNEILTVEEIWSGQIWRGSVRAFAYDQAGNRGVSFALINCQRVKRDCTRIDGRVPANKDFDDIETGDDEVETSEESIF